MKNIIKRILKEETDVTKKIKNAIGILFPDTLVYTDYFNDYYNDEEVEFNVRVTYRLSEKTKIEKDKVGGVKKYVGNIVFDILKLESTTYDNPNEYKTFYYQDDIEELFWEIFTESLYEKIESVFPFLYIEEIQLEF